MLFRLGDLVKWYNNGLQILLGHLLKFIYFNYLISYRGLVKWYNNGLQNHCCEFDSCIPCQMLMPPKLFGVNIDKTIENKGNSMVFVLPWKEVKI